MIIRSETVSDRPAIHELNRQAFESEAEANLVDMLRQRASPLISLVAEVNGKIVGHILFTPVELTGQPSAFIMGLAPMAVTKKFRGQGIGSMLVESGLEACRKLGVGAVVVLGHIDYYPKFGFKPASRFNLTCEYDVPDEAFMAIELDTEFLATKSGVVKYHDAFASV